MFNNIQCKQDLGTEGGKTYIGVCFFMKGIVFGAVRRLDFLTLIKFKAMLVMKFVFAASILLAAMLLRNCNEENPIIKK